MPEYRLVETQAALAEAAAALAGAERLYLDTEFESSRDGASLCLLQVARDQQIFLVDAVRLRDLSPLSPVLGARDTEWVLHAAQQDVPLLLDRLGLKSPPRVFDTQVAWALLGPEYSVSLAYLQFRLLGIRSVKSHQADDWKRRPLPHAQLAYAASDVEHLPALRRELGARAAQLGREQAVCEATLELVWSPPDLPVPIRLDSFRNAWQLDHKSQAALRWLIHWYNDQPVERRSDLPDPKTFLAIASRLPRDAADLGRIKGIPRRWAASEGERFTTLLWQAVDGALAADFVPIDPPPYATFEEIRLEAWLTLLRAEVAANLSMAPELALPGRLVRALKAGLGSGDRGAPEQLLTGWRKTLVLPELLQAMQQAAPRSAQTTR